MLISIESHITGNMNFKLLTCTVSALRYLEILEIQYMRLLTLRFFFWSKNRVSPSPMVTVHDITEQKSTNRYLHDYKPRFVNIITCM